MGTQVIPPPAEPKDFAALRSTWPDFYYEGFDTEFGDGFLTVTYRFSIPGLTTFNPSLRFPVSKGMTLRATDERAQTILFNLGLVELISYWKTTCAPNVHIVGRSLDQRQRRFWKNLYFGGLGEFFYRNGIQTTWDSFMTLHAEEQKNMDSTGAALTLRSPVTKTATRPEKMLVPVGGGKDSAVTLARLAGVRDEVYTFGINATGAAIDTMEVAGIEAERRLLVSRTLDRNMLLMNRLGYWNGHTPFSAIVAFTALYVAHLHDLNYIVLSNESSADEATVLGTDVNHQFSKSSDFERAFQAYTEQYIGSGAYYFSLMRPFTELAIAREFAKHPVYFPVFRSCNVGSKENRWCGTCAKCLFIYIVLSPFIDSETMVSILGSDLFEDPNLERDLAGLCGRVSLKPWECVGTVSEVNVALCLTIASYLGRGTKVSELPLLLRAYLAWVEAGEVPSVHLTASGRPIAVILDTAGPLQQFNTEHRVPDVFLPLIQGMIEE